MNICVDACMNQCSKSAMRSKHGAVILLRKKIVASACNIQISDRDPPPFASIHAEVNVIQKFLDRFPRRYLRSCTLIVIRMDREGNLQNSKPCANCEEYIIKHSIPKVIYST